MSFGISFKPLPCTHIKKMPQNDCQPVVLDVELMKLTIPAYGSNQSNTYKYIERFALYSLFVSYLFLKLPLSARTYLSNTREW